MQPASPLRKWLLLGGVFILLPIIYFLISTGKSKYRELPILGPHEALANGDTLYHEIPPFSFTGIDGKPVTDKTLEGKILIVDFFFTRCGTICPRMSAHMRELLHLQLTTVDGYGDIVFLSHTVDPENDSVEVLANYAREYSADTARWKFVTGDKEALYTQGSEGYLLAAKEDVLAPGVFLHSENFVLVDKRRHIRGFYDGTDPAKVKELVTDAKMLMGEERKRVRLEKEKHEQ
ncbi:MAG: SCO family protein [Flavobacteriales bacterium]|nr:SCO family protein [Flavobacteriales bacterium]